MVERGIISNGERGSPEDSDDNPPPNIGLNRIDDIISEASNSSDYLKIKEDTSNSTVNYPGRKDTIAYFNEIKVPGNYSTVHSIFYKSDAISSNKKLEFDEDMDAMLISETCDGDIELGYVETGRALYECMSPYDMH